MEDAHIFAYSHLDSTSLHAPVRTSSICQTTSRRALLTARRRRSSVVVRRMTAASRRCGSVMGKRTAEMDPTKNRTAVTAFSLQYFMMSCIILLLLMVLIVNFNFIIEAQKGNKAMEKHKQTERKSHVEIFTLFHFTSM